jgi:hypothetical protein
MLLRLRGGFEMYRVFEIPIWAGWKTTIFSKTPRLNVFKGLTFGEPMNVVDFLFSDIIRCLSPNYV